MRRETSPVGIDLLKTMVEGAQDGLVIVSATGVILYANRLAAQFDGLPKEALLGRRVEDLLLEGYFDRSVNAEVIAKQVGATRIQTLKDGRKTLVSGKPIFSANGQLRYVVTTIRDVTELDRLMGHLQETTRLSERYRSELRRFAMRDMEIIARSEPMRSVRERAVQYAMVDSPVLLVGETGTGKGVIAKLIHGASPRNAGPFLEVNCGAIPDGLLEAELFGYARGAFTGADPRGKVGFIELAHAGTLLLNEVGDLPLSLQVKLLGFLENGVIQAVGSIKSKRPDVRIIAATHRDLVQMIDRGAFRQDLFYRLNVLTIHIPPLRERREDIPALVAMMLAQLERRFHKVHRATSRALDLISQYSFPGNVRELWNLIERVVITTGRETIDIEDLPAELSRPAARRFSSRPGEEGLRATLNRVEAAMLREALDRWGSQMAAARHLGVSQATIARKVKRYRLADVEGPAVKHLHGSGSGASGDGFGS
jgi:PAS domain S-box-containing protein